MKSGVKRTFTHFEQATAGLLDPRCDRVAVSRPVVERAEHEKVERQKRDGIPYHGEVVEWFNTAAQELEVSYALPDWFLPYKSKAWGVEG